MNVKRKKILVVVDFQNDFVDPNGALPVPGAPALWQNIQDLIDSGDYDRVVYTFDTHTPDEYNGSAEQQIFPGIHCEFGTAGWYFYKITPQNGDAFEAFVRNAAQPFEKMTIGKESFFTKNVFDIWQGNKAYPDWFTNEFPADEVDVDVVGVATEFCVKMNVDGLVKRGYKVNVFTDCIASITPEGEQEAMEGFVNSGVTFK